MRKIVCECCEREAVAWLVFESVGICHSCRLTAIDRMRAMGFGLHESHPFTDELMDVQRPPRIFGTR